MNEVEILNYAQMNFIQNGLYMVAFTAFVFITFRLMRFQREQNANVFVKVLVTIFGLCTTFFGYNVFHFYMSINLDSHTDFRNFNLQGLN